MRAGAGIEVRQAGLADLPPIAAVALATGQDEEWGGADPAYMTHLLAQGSVVVGVTGGSVIGFGAIRQLGDGPGAVTMLRDLFVHLRMHGSGCGRLLRTRRSGRFLPLAGGSRSSICSWRPIRTCWTRAGQCRPRRWPDQPLRKPKTRHILTYSSTW